MVTVCSDVCSDVCSACNRAAPAAPAAPAPRPRLPELRYGENTSGVSMDIMMFYDFPDEVAGSGVLDGDEDLRRTSRIALSDNRPIS